MSHVALWGQPGFVTVALACSLFAASVPKLAVAAEADAPAVGSARVVLRLDPARIDEQQASELLRLLEVELGASGLTLAHEFGAEQAARWFSRRDLADAVLLVALVGEGEAWRVVMIEPSRRLGASRTLPGGASNAANLEAVASIVLTAATALADGHNVVTAPMDEVLAPPEAKPSPPGPSPKAPARASVVRPPQAVPATAPQERRSSWWTLGLGGGATTFEASVPVSLAATGHVGWVLRDRLAVDLGVSHQPASRFESGAGSFELSRWVYWLGAGPSWNGTDWAFVSQVSVAAESISRSQTQPSVDVSANSERALARFGGRFSTSARWSLLGSMGLRATLFGTWYPRAIRLTAAGGEEVVAEPWAAGFGAFVGFSWWL